MSPGLILFFADSNYQTDKVWALNDVNGIIIP